MTILTQNILLWLEIRLRIEILTKAFGKPEEFRLEIRL